MAARLFTSRIFLAVVPILALGGMLLAGAAPPPPPPQAPEEPPAPDDASSGSQGAKDTPVSDGTRREDPTPAELVTFEIFLTNPGQGGGEDDDDVELRQRLGRPDRRGGADRG
ncbi:hypothetical protein Hte_009068 [Hypoxylon texense]